MVQKTFTCDPSDVVKKIAKLREQGWTIITTANTSTPCTEPDARGVSYGGAEVSILCEKEYEKPKIYDTDWENGMLIGRPCNPPRPGGR